MSREASKLWKKVCSEMNVEIKLLLGNWKYILGGMVFRITLIKNFCKEESVYFRSCTYMCRWREEFINCISLNQYSRTLFFSLYLGPFPPFIYQNKKFLPVLRWCQVLADLVASVILRIVTFYSTQPPSPNYQCREGSKLSRLPSPESAYELLLLKFTRGVFYGRGDLIFLPHMIFTLAFVNIYHQYGTKRK